MFISFDDGSSWNSFQLNLPLVPITDLAIKNDNLIASTQGRSLWIIDDLTPIHQITKEIEDSNFHIFSPIDSYRMGNPGWGGSSNAGQNHHNGVEIFFNINKELIKDSSNISLEFLDNKKQLIKKYSNTDKKNQLKINGGKNSFVWNMRYNDAKDFDGLIMWAANLRGPKAAPGSYFVRLNINENSIEKWFNILKDPRSNSSIEDLKNQFDFLMSIRDKVTSIHETIIQIKSTRKQLNDLKHKLDENHNELRKDINDVVNKITKIEKTLYQTKNRSGQDPLNFPIKLNNKLAHLASIASAGNYKPTNQMYGVRDKLIQKIDIELNLWNNIKENKLEKINTAIKESNIQLISIN